MSRFRDKAVARAVGQAIHHYDMISHGDRIAVGLSGGKDSLTLLWVLQERLSRIPIHYSLVAIHIDLGFEGGPARLVEAYCEEMGYALRVEYTDYGIRGHSEENRENPCFLCSRLRRKRLFEVAHELGCNKLALGHNMDDIIETLFLNMCYSGEISTMGEKAHLSGPEHNTLLPPGRPFTDHRSPDDEQQTNPQQDGKPHVTVGIDHAIFAPVRGAETTLLQNCGRTLDQR